MSKALAKQSLNSLLANLAAKSPVASSAAGASGSSNSIQTKRRHGQQRSSGSGSTTEHSAAVRHEDESETALHAHTTKAGVRKAKERQAQTLRKQRQDAARRKAAQSNPLKNAGAEGPVNYAAENLRMLQTLSTGAQKVSIKANTSTTKGQRRK
ncbi:hypothetical protein CAOG_02690 [Capsaspora owczarzaki ATCC 30864]|uniref:Uncharacterized protein n=1 Tax=Capsaspora owczarzaki (strain ATCC 30864) TaxID=595528 RepID=A0A0D2X1X4_CAPO3|nr:hypothetical protein CAOG_02690 [Capsaspora owczarzaki ATCC 30864]KJE91564.1 hypothetical protein CAOG_002690 [Capsaspora owczarzaki ATCC 30864]|eukprot:XP_004349440.1 hypothetical protein CAOG_02690 [Capsaspora owczarzaki ATCC 30864]